MGASEKTVPEKTAPEDPVPENPVPQKAERRALAPVVRRIKIDAKRVGKTHRGAMDTIAEWLTYPDLNMSGVWEKAGLHSRYASALKRDLKVKPHLYLRQCRLEVAGFLFLDESLAEVEHKEVAKAAGYDDYKLFGDHFRQWTGQTPTAFRVAPGPEILEHLRRVRESEDEDVPEPDAVATPPAAVVAHRPVLAEVHADVVRTLAEERLTRGRLAAVAGRFDEALEVLPLVLDASGSVDDALVGTANAFLGYVLHQRAARRVECGEVDDAYHDAADATGHYLCADRLPRRLEEYRGRVAIGHDPREPLLRSLCRTCRPRLLGPAGRQVRHHLDHAFEPMPRDLPWFRDACDDCYRAVWDAVVRARLGFLDDAWQAVWISRLAEPFDDDAVPSRGRFIALLHAAEQITFGHQGERARLCRQAVHVAVKLREPELEALARLHYGNALRAMGRHEEAEDEFLRAETTAKASPWLWPFWNVMVAVLWTQKDEYDIALSSLQAAFQGYQGLDAHLAGMTRMQEGELHRAHHRYTDAVEAFRLCEPLLDGRRAPLMAGALLPINRASAFNGLAEWDRASEALGSCAFDRREHQGVFAAELGNKACLELGRGRPEEALPAFAEARVHFEAQNRWLDVGLLEVYRVEGHVAVEDRFRAIESCAEAVRIFRKVGCDGKTQEALARLSQLLEPITIDVAAVVVCVRQLARRHGGCLPLPAPSSRG